MPNEVATIRKKMKLTPGAFGAIFGVHRTTIMRWERDGKPEPSEAVLRWMREESVKFDQKHSRTAPAEQGAAA